MLYHNKHFAVIDIATSCFVLLGAQKFFGKLVSSRGQQRYPEWHRRGNLLMQYFLHLVLL